MTFTPDTTGTYDDILHQALEAAREILNGNGDPCDRCQAASRVFVETAQHISGMDHGLRDSINAIAMGDGMPVIPYTRKPLVAVRHEGEVS